MSDSANRHNGVYGVYVVIGGAGGLGEVGTRHMVSRYDADVVWIGRRAPDAEIECAVAALGRRPRYFAADASDETALADAVQRIHAIFPRIDGVVHSALVLQDKSVRGMDETVFRQGLAAKVDLSVNLEKVFRDCDLDFMLFFSSLSSYSRGAGCTFKDSFAHAMRSVWSVSGEDRRLGQLGQLGLLGLLGQRRHRHRRLLPQAHGKLGLRFDRAGRGDGSAGKFRGLGNEPAGAGESGV
ncbi:MAG: SDR family NAD(P)-dependent oxidoreductase [Pseudomonadota bacterium]|nr:SDR family NAD(P)-dependent oxidoreductase [Pseudomonadota bacterium]